MPNIIYEQAETIAKITLNRPEKMNAYNVALHSELLDAIQRADADNSVRVIVVTGAGRAFCVGADIQGGFGGAGLDEAETIDGVTRDYGGMLVLGTFDCDTPIIGAMNGHAVGVGATMTLPYDIRILSSKAKMAFPFSRRGIVFDGAASFFLPRIVGLGKTQEWLLKGDIILSDEALSSGLVHEVVEPDQVLSRAMELAEDIAVNVSPQSAAWNKQLIRASIYGQGAYDTPGMSAHMRESKILEQAFKAPDCAEGVTSFFEKRPPKFKDRA